MEVQIVNTSFWVNVVRAGLLGGGMGRGRDGNVLCDDHDAAASTGQ